MLNVFSLLLTPRKTLTRIAAKPDWLMTFLILSAISVVIAFLMHPFVINATLAHLPDSATSAEKEAVAQSLRSDLPVRCFFLPVRLIVGWSAFAFVLFLTAKSFAPPSGVRFIKVFALTVHAELVTVLSSAATLINMSVGGDSVPNGTALVPFSAAAYIDAKDIVSFALLNSLNFFTLVYIVLLTEGMSKITGFSRPKSLLVVMLTWSTYMLFNVGTIRFLRDTMHLLI